MSDHPKDGIIEMLELAGLPITRQNYIEMAYGADVPEPWTWEYEEGLPEFLQAPFTPDQPPPPPTGG